MGFFDKFRGPKPETKEPEMKEEEEKDILDVELPTEEAGEEVEEKTNPEETEE